MEQTNSKKKTLTVAAAAVAVLALVGVIAYLADASGTIRNIFSSDHSTHLEVEITETDVPHDNGDKQYDVTPGSTADKDPKVSVDTNGDAYVYAIVKDTINNNAEGRHYVDYQIADGWVELDKSTLTDKDIQKYNEIFTDKDMDADTVHIDVNDPNTRIFYRIVNGTDDVTRFEYPVLKDNSISYPSTLTNDDLAYLKSIADDKDRALDFQTYAIQMTPFCPADKVKDADPTSDEQKGYAAEAWNQKAPAPAATDSNRIETTAHTLTVYPTVPGNQYIVVPKGATPTEADWTSTGQTSNGGEALTFTGLDADTEYDVISRTPATSDQGEASDPSEPTTAATRPLATSVTVTEKTGIEEPAEIAVGETLQMVATVGPEDADQDVVWSSSNPEVATVDPVTGKVTAVSPGTAQIIATTKDGSNVKDQFDVTVLSGKFLYQVVLHDVTNGTATFYPVTNNPNINRTAYGKVEHDGDCILDHTYAEIASGSYDFSNCKCTKDVPIDLSKNSAFFNTLKEDAKDSNIRGYLLKDPAASSGWNHSNLTNQVTNACTIKDDENVTVTFFDLSEAQVKALGNENYRYVWNERGYKQGYWTSTQRNGKGVAVSGGNEVGGQIIEATKTDSRGVCYGMKVKAN